MFLCSGVLFDNSDVPPTRAILSGFSRTLRAFVEFAIHGDLLPLTPELICVLQTQQLRHPNVALQNLSHLSPFISISVHLHLHSPPPPFISISIYLPSIYLKQNKTSPFDVREL